MAKTLLEVKNLKTEFRRDKKSWITAVNGISFTVNAGEIVGLVGESGCGKSVTSLSVMRLLDKDSSRVTGEVSFEGTDVLGLSEGEMQSVRGNDILEEAPVEELFANPQHPYTQGLIASVPRLGKRVRRLPSISGSVPDLAAMPKGCRFAPRCKYAQPQCWEGLPPTHEAGPNHRCACLFRMSERKEALAHD